ncbi:MAG: DUF3820 family protein [Rhabdochlamydiaceae bacterium]|nr:DUF3820 family protein [Candidatus Amphrikana amoebophyrae]
MKPLNKTTFICIDCESTGLDTKKDSIIEIAITKFTFEETLDSFESLVDPGCSIPQESIQIHNITNDMVKGKPHISQVLPNILSMAKDNIIIGHNIQFDIDLVCHAATLNKIPCKLHTNPSIDTLRLARLYGESPTNSLAVLREHFNIPDEGAHRAMSDVIVNMQVFQKLTTKFKSAQQILEKLKKPIQLRTMPLGKHKGREFREIPADYLSWASRQNFDQDLLYSIKSELKKRKNRGGFEQSSNPFSNL